MKIITVTANPAVDVVYALGGGLVVDGLNRAASSVIYPGGKGINVSRAVARDGGETVACAMLGGHVGGLFWEMLREEGLSVAKTTTAAQTRVNICAASPLSSDATEINAPGGPVTRRELDALTNTVTEQASSGDVVVLAGSLPTCGDGDAEDYYRSLLPVLAEKGCTVLLDASGAALRQAVEGDRPPHLIKPNRHELRELLPSPFDGIPEGEGSEEAERITEAVETASATLASRGISVLCTLGAMGSVFTSSKNPARPVRQPAVPVSCVTNVKGAGDTFLGVFAHRHFILNETIEVSLAKAAAAASAHVGGRSA